MIVKGEGRRLIEQWLSEGKIPIFYCDMDGVAANFEKGALDDNLSCKEFKLKRGAYLELEPYPHIFKILDEIEKLGAKIEMLTKIPDKNPYAATEKLLWLLKHEEKRAVDVTITRDKGNHGNKWSFLMDDRIHKANVKNFPGVILHFGKDGMFKDLSDIVYYFDLDYQF